MDDRINGLLKGAIDLHCHSGPSVMPRCLNHVEAIKQGEEAGLRAILFKDHYYSVTPIAALLDEIMPGSVKLFTGVPSADGDRTRFALRDLLEPAMRTETLLVWVTAFAYAIVGYFLMSWKPTILANAGLSPSMAAASVTIGSAFGIAGHLSMGLFARRTGEGRLTAVYFLLATISLFAFGTAPGNPIALILLAGVTNFFVVGAYTGLFLVAVEMYPPERQNTGLGFIVGFVRVGAAVGPILGGFLLSAGLSRMDTYFVFTAIAAVPAVTMYLAARLTARRRISSSAGALSEAF